MDDELDTYDVSLPRVRRHISVWRFWFNPYFTVIITAPVALLTAWATLWYALNGIFANLVLVLWNPLVWLVVIPVWWAMTFGPAYVIVSLFSWLPQIWNKSWALVLRGLAIVGLWLGLSYILNLWNQIEWAIFHWIGAGNKAAELIDRAPYWAQIFGVSDPHYLPLW